MDRYVVESRTKELIIRTQRLKTFLARQAEASQNQKDVLLLETTACLSELAELNGVLLEEQVKLAEQYGMYHESSDDLEHEEMYMLCPHCHEALFFGKSALVDASTKCPRCHHNL